MSERSEIENAGVIWRNQPEEEVTVQLEQIVNRRTKELGWSTRWEILMSVCAALLFVGVVLLRVAPLRDGLLETILAAAGVWAILSLYLFRRKIWRPESSRADAAAATGREYYRRELERRRDHLRNAWLWHGPLFLACLALIAVAAGNSFLGFERLGSATPLLALLAAWTAFGVRRRLRQAREIQREIDEIEPRRYQ
jgi:Flp pilus assembly protein TadB